MAHESLNLPYVVLTGVVLIATGVSFLVLVPVYKNVHAVRASSAAVAAQLEERQVFFQSFDRKIALLASQTSRERELEVVLPSDASAEDVLRLLHTAAGQTQVTVDGARDVSSELQSELRARQARGELTTAVPSGVLPHGITLKVRGTYQQFRQLFDVLEHSPRLMQIQSVVLTRSTVDPLALSGDVTVLYYSYSLSTL